MWYGRQWNPHQQDSLPSTTSQNCALFSLNVSGLPPVSPRTREFKISALYLTRPRNQILPHPPDTVLLGEVSPRKLTYGAGWGLFVALAY